MDINYGPNSNRPPKLKVPNEKKHRRSSILKPPNSRRSIALGELNGNTPDTRDRKKKSAGRRVSFAPQDDFWVFKKADAPSKTDGETEKLRSTKPSVNFSGGWSNFSDLKEVSELTDPSSRKNELDPEDAEMNTDTIYEEMTRPRGTTITLSIAESDMDLTDAHVRSDKSDSPPPGRSLKDASLSRIPVPITPASSIPPTAVPTAEHPAPQPRDQSNTHDVGDNQGDAMATLFEGDNLSDVDMEETVALPIRVETFPALFNGQSSGSNTHGELPEVPRDDTCNLEEEMELTKCLPSLLPQHTSASRPAFPEFQRAQMPALDSNAGAQLSGTDPTTYGESSVPVTLLGSKPDEHVLNDSFEEDFGSGRADATVRMDMTELVGRGILQASGLSTNENAENNGSGANENTEYMDFTEVVGGVLSTLKPDESAGLEDKRTNSKGSGQSGAESRVPGSNNIVSDGTINVPENTVDLHVDMDIHTTNTLHMDMTEAVGGILQTMPTNADMQLNNQATTTEAVESQTNDTDRMDMTEAVGRIVDADGNTAKVPNFFLPALVSDEVSRASQHPEAPSQMGSKRSSPRANEKAGEAARANQNAENEHDHKVAKKPRRESEQLVSTLQDLSVQPSAADRSTVDSDTYVGIHGGGKNKGLESKETNSETSFAGVTGLDTNPDTDRVLLHPEVDNNTIHTTEHTAQHSLSHTQNLTHTQNVTHNLTTTSTTGMLDVSSISHSPTTARSLNTTRVLAATQAGLLIAQSSVATATAPEPSVEPKVEAADSNQAQDDTLVAMATSRSSSRLSVSRAPTPVKDLGPPTVNPISVHDFLSLSQTHFMDNLVTRRRTTMLNGKLVKIETLTDRLRVACTLEPKLTLLEQNCSMLDRMTKDTRKKIEAQEKKLNIHNPDIFQALRDATSEDRASMRQILGEVKQFSRLQARNMWAAWRLQAETRVSAMLGEKARVVREELEAWGPDTREKIAEIKTKLNDVTEALTKERIALGLSIMDEQAYEHLAHNYTAGKEQNVAIATFEGTVHDLNVEKESAYRSLGELQDQQMQLKELIGTRHDEISSKQAKLAVWNALTPADVDAMHDELMLETTLQQWYPQIVDHELVVFALQEGAFLIHVSLHPKIAANEKSQRIASIGVEQTHMSQEASSELLRALLDCGLFDDLTDRFTTSEQIPELLEELSFALERVKKLANEIDGLRNIYHMTVDPAASGIRGCVDLQVDIIRASKGVRVTLGFKDVGIVNIQALQLETTISAIGPVCLKTITSAANTYNGPYRRLELICNRVGEILRNL